MSSVRRYGGVGLLLTSVGLNVLLSQELRASRAVAPALGVGTPVPPISGVSGDGAEVTVAYDTDLPTVLYYFKTDCGWCERNWANVEALIDQTRGRYRVIGLAASPKLPQYLTDRDGLLPVVRNVDRDTLATYKFSATPQTVVVSPEGLVVASWMGAYQQRQAEAIAEFFDVTMPGLLSGQR